jgi:hypothetical protein
MDMYGVGAGGCVYVAVVIIVKMNKNGKRK